MNYLNEVRCFLSTRKGVESFQRVLIRPYKLTLQGAEKILRKMHKLDEREGICPDAHVSSIHHTQFADR